MFKKIANLFFEDVEIEEEDLVIPPETIEAKDEPVRKVEKKEVNKEALDRVLEKHEPVEQKSFVEVKEKSIFITNSVEQKKVEKKDVKTERKPVSTSYKFTPIISPIRGLKDGEKNEYETKKPVPKRRKTSHLGTVISPFYGASDEEDVEENQVDVTVEEIVEEVVVATDMRVEEASFVKEPSLKEEFVNLTLDDLIDAEVTKGKPDSDKVHYFIGIKGTGMSALANLLHAAGYTVMGSDTENYVFTEVELEEKGIEIHPFGANKITSDMIVIVGNSFYDDHVDVLRVKEVGAKAYTYPEFLGKYLSEFTSVAVSGSHGKTTTTSMIADMLRVNVPTAHLIGDGRGQVDSGAEIIAVEACEYKRHFLSYKADFAVITNLEWDHVDYFHTVQDYLDAFEEFANQISNTVLIYGDDPYAKRLNIKTDVLYYGESATNDLFVKNIIEEHTHSSFDVVFLGKEIGNFKINRTGRHMIHNALASIGIGLLLGFSADDIRKGLLDYQGARRRFEVTEIGESVVIDDYAHHPTEVKVTLEAARTKYPDRKIIAVYHPDRIKRLETFKDDFIDALSIADQTVVGSAVDSDGMTAVIDTSVLIENLDDSFVVDDKISSVSALAYLSPAVFVFMGTKEMHHLKMGLIDYLKKIDI